MWQSLMPRLSEQVVWGVTPHGSFHGSDLMFIGDLDEVGEVQCSDLWMDKAGRQSRKSGQQSQDPKGSQQAGALG